MKLITLILGLSLFAIMPLTESSATATQQVRPTPHPSTQDPEVLVTPDQMSLWEADLSNWGRWGPSDQRGTLNLITPEKTRAAASLVEDGVTVSLGHFVSEEDAIDSQTFAPT